MATCYDIFGNPVKQFVFNDDGTVYAAIENSQANDQTSTYEQPTLYQAPEGTVLTPLSQDCCVGFNYMYNSSNNLCYWADICDPDVSSEFKVILGSTGNDGSVFQVDDNEFCQLEVKFQYMFQFDCASVQECTVENDCLSIFKNVDVDTILDRLVPDQQQGGNKLETVYRGELFKIDDIVEHFRDNCNTGFYVTGDTICLDQLRQCVIAGLGDDCEVFSACTLDSGWLEHSYMITDDGTLDLIENQKIQIGFLVNNMPCDFSILIDRIEINKVCTAVDKTEIYVSKCPKFELERVCDNKKSWVAEETTTDRSFNLTQRETEYDIKHHKLAINTKEIDLDISIANAIETDVWSYIQNNPDVLTASTGTTEVCLSGLCGDVGLDFTELLSSEVTGLTTVKEFTEIIQTELIDAKNRKTINSYATLKALFERYRNGFQTSANSSSFNYDSISNFVTLVGDYWVDLIEQVIPSTTIWGSTYKYGNTIFDSNKFVYKPYTLFTCTNCDTRLYPSPVSGYNETVEVITEDLTNPVFTGPVCLEPYNPETICSGVTIHQTNYGSEFIGKVIVMGEETYNDCEGDAAASGATITNDPIVAGECDLRVVPTLCLSGSTPGTFTTGRGEITEIINGTAPYNIEYTMAKVGNYYTRGVYADWEIISVDPDGLGVTIGGPAATPTNGVDDAVYVWLKITDARGCFYQVIFGTTSNTCK